MIIRPNWARKVCYMILFIGGPVDWEGGPVDWGVGGWDVWETWVGDIGYCGRERLLDSPGLRVKIFDNAIY